MKKILSHIDWRMLKKTGHLVHSLNLYRFTKQAILLTAIGIFIGVHLLLSFVTLRLDLSKGAAYTLSKSSKQIIQTLDKPVTITLYTSNNLPPRVTPVKRDVIDLLREYERASSNVIFKEVTFNATEDVKIVQQLAQLGIVGIPVREQDQNEVSLTEVYFGVTLQIGEAEQPVSEPFNIENLEYNITSSVYRLTNTNLATIGILGLEEGFNPQQDEMGLFKQILGSQFLTQTIPLPSTQEEEIGGAVEPFSISPDIDALIIVDTAENSFSPEVLDAIDAYLKTGSALVFLNGVTIDNAIQVGPGEEGLTKLLGAYGITVEDNLVLSSRSEFVNLGSGGFSLPIPYPYWVWTPDVATENNYAAGISRITFPWSSALTITNSDTVRYLAKSSGDSWSVSGTIDLNPQQIQRPTEADIDTFVLAAEAKTSESGSLSVIGSSRFLLNNYLNQESQNVEFVLNILGNYASDGALSGIRSRAVTIYPLPPFTEQAQEVYKYAVILLLPLLFGVYGGFRLWKRNKTS